MGNFTFGFLWEILTSDFCGKFYLRIFVGNFIYGFLWEVLPGGSGRARSVLPGTGGRPDVPGW